MKSIDAYLSKISPQVGDTILIGKFKNRKAVIKGFGKDENNHPVIKTNKGDVKMFKFRIAKLMPEKKEEPENE